MKYVINLLILGLIVFLAYALYSGIQEPIKFRDELNKRKNTVTAKLEQIRSSQEIYRDIKGSFASTFEDLIYTLQNDSIPFIKLEADPEDPTNEDKFIRSTSYTPAINTVREKGINLEGLAIVPYSDNVKFEMKADTITYQSTMVPVVECMTRYKEFMGAYSDPRFRQYDDDFDPNNRLGFGSMSSPNLEGNWN